MRTTLSRPWIAAMAVCALSAIPMIACIDDLDDSDPAESGDDEQEGPPGDVPVDTTADFGAESDDSAAAPAGCEPYFGTSGTRSAWVYVDRNGGLAYKKLNPEGDRIIDFSYAGYRGGGVTIPTVPVKETLSPGGGDDTAAIQAALDRVAHLPLSGGVRGAVLLRAGTFKVNGNLKIGASGVVLRGSGSGTGAGATKIVVGGGSHRFLSISGGGSRSAPSSPATTLTDAYVPVGARSFKVASASGFAVGDDVLVTRPVTQPWIELMGMDKLVRNGRPQTWIAAGSKHQWERRITGINGTTITIDIPLTDSLDARYVKPPAGKLTRYSFGGRISEVGVEHLRVVAPPRSAEVEMGLVNIDKAADSWVRDVAAHNFTNGLGVGGSSTRITIEDVHATHDMVSYFTSAAPADFSVNAQQVLLQRCSSDGGNKIFYFVTHSTRGPNVVLDFHGTGKRTHFEPHQRWATGLLADGVALEGGIGFANRGTAGSGHGWTIGWGVAWNCESSTKVLRPPGAMNWAIGCIGNVSAEAGTPGMPGSPNLPRGIHDSQGQHVIPDSLYLAQLCQRLGPQAVANIGW